MVEMGSIASLCTCLGLVLKFDVEHNGQRICTAVSDPSDSSATDAELTMCSAITYAVEGIHNDIFSNTRMQPSRMHTARSLTISHSIRYLWMQTPPGRPPWMQIPLSKPPWM